MTTSAARWSRGVIALHWLSAAGLALVFALGLAATANGIDAARKFDLYQTHKALGWLTLLLLAARLAARARRVAPPPMPDWSRATRWSSRFVHAALYALLAAIPLVGWLRVSTAIVPIPVSLFGWATIPNIAPTNAELSDVLAFAHEFGAWTLAALVALHVAAALKHQLIDRDAILARMWPRRDGRTL
jgi:cytochrome b561